MVNQTVLKVFILIISLDQCLGESPSCDFESDLCGWYELSTTSLKWRLRTGRTPDFTSGPQGDHTHGNGQYLYIHGSETVNSSTLALAFLQSPILQIHGTTQMTFWYHMNGVGIGSLVVYANNQSGSRKLAWQRVGRQGPDWNQGHVNIDTDVQQVIFMATTRFHYGSDLAIDDIIFDPNPSVLTTVSQTYPTTVSQTHPSTSPPRRYLTCDFEVNLCGWEQDGELQWELKHGASPDRTSGIVDAHGGRQYVFLNGHKAVNSSYVARLDSGQVFFQPGTNISFWYHMNGAGIGSLNLLQRTPDGNVISLWSRTGRQSPEWLKAEVSLPPGTYHLIFEASAQYHFGSDIGLDDIFLSVQTLCVSWRREHKTFKEVVKGSFRIILRALFWGLSIPAF